MAGLRRGVAAVESAGTAGFGRPGRPQRRRQQELGKQRSAPWPGPRSKEKKKVNCKPKNQDEQEIPFRLREIMRSRQEMKNPISNKKRKKEAQAAFSKTLEKEAKGGEPDIAVPKFKQRKWESNRAYVRRMEQEAQHVLFLSKNQANRQPEVQVAPKKEKSERKKAFQKRRLDKARQRREEKAAERLEQELLQAWQEITDAEEAFKPWWCVPASDHLTGQTEDRGGGEGAGRERLQGAKETAAAGDSVATATPPRSREEARDAAVMTRDQSCCTWAGAGQADGLQSRVLSQNIVWDSGGGAGSCFFSLETALSGVTIRWTHISHRALSVS
ncbi:coiled-coil domain-containing protein 137 isoform X1 [Cervus elaphus]|uniref:coiled-coil domain-containing protein 137 isoform X1 n=1 Tax=Cervus elaphus TaxID=9860 RepID=UPI001CC2EFD0|nr:coiled-coil domain-containing protein 137 isoform X1 [Cervus elaphus]